MATVDLGFLDIFEEAFERAGLELRSGYSLKSIRRSFNLLMMDWANKGLNLWTIGDATINCVSGTSVYSLPTDTIDLIEHTIRDPDTNTEIALARIAVGTWAKQTNKTQTGRPTQVYIERTTAPQVTLWPVPDKAYVFRYWSIDRMDGLSSGIDGTVDLPSRFIEPLISGLAYNVALKSQNPQVVQRVPILKQAYDECFQMAADEDRDRASYRIIPGQIYR